MSGNAADPGKGLYADLTALLQSLHAVTNNAPASIGGGGTPRVPTKPPHLRRTLAHIFIWCAHKHPPNIEPNLVTLAVPT